MRQHVTVVFGPDSAVEILVPAGVAMAAKGRPVVRVDLAAGKVAA
jgi:hypothetical protein